MATVDFAHRHTAACDLFADEECNCTLRGIADPAALIEAARDLLKAQRILEMDGTLVEAGTLRDTANALGWDAIGRLRALLEPAQGTESGDGGESEG